MIIRSLMSRDREAVHRILVQRKVFNEKEIPVALEVLDEYLKKGTESGYEAWGAFSDSKLGGYLCFGPIPLTDERYDLYWIAVDGEMAEKGIGTSLLEFMEKEIRKRGGGRVYVETSSTAAYHPARSFYRKNGYAVIAVLEEYYRPGDDKVIFLKDLGLKK